MICTSFLRASPTHIRNTQNTIVNRIIICSFYLHYLQLYTNILHISAPLQLCARLSQESLLLYIEIPKQTTIDTCSVPHMQESQIELKIQVI